MKLAEPAWLALLLLVPFFVAGAIITSRLRRKQWSAFAAPRLRAKLLRRGSPVPRWLSFGFLMLAVVLLAIGMARPQTTKGSETEMTRGRNVLLALDLSRSMLVTDLKPDRLTQAKTLCYELIEALPTDRIGLIGFAGEPYPFAPLTVDHAAVRETIQQLDMDFIPVGGSNVKRALELSIKTLKETGQKENALILLTDGDETLGRMSELAAEAKRSGVYIFAIAVGTEQGDFVPNKDFPDGRHRDDSNRPVRSGINTAGLKKLASETGGRFAVATSAANIPDMVKTAISDLEQFEIEGRERFVPVEYYQWFIFPGIIMLIASIIAGTRWRALGPASTAAAAAAALIALTPQPLRADTEDDAKLALKEGRNDQAAELFGSLADKSEDRERGFRFRLAQGNALYRQKDLEKARHAFSEALRSQDPQVRAAAHHGMGTVLFGTGWKSLSAGQAYPEVAKKEEGKAKPNPFKKIVDSILGLFDQKDKGDQPSQMAAFDGMVREALSEWMQESTPDSGETNGFNRFDTTLTDWVDAVKHFDTALRYDSGSELAKHNRALTVKYLKRLEEILNEVGENAQQIQPMPMPGQGKGEGKQPEGDGEGDQQGEGEKGDQPGEGKGDKGEEKKDGSGGDDDKQQDGEGGDNPSDKKDGEGKDAGDKKQKEGETPEDAARRILRENADFEKGVIGPRRAEYRQPEKDW
ncbi:VWA domain-containing protein [Luteolibacter luteus]|uniref:VWA domain-containing protein n=1 Tax=Luteolibacter luteus TaxID=2728835 RepID=A0A858RNQ8_9BACT|nr:VWA domain-containing protein [Luteolibacter luteus]QJE99066.1 VWA domain-containing protein [Luteolibacter luteus]